MRRLVKSTAVALFVFSLAIPSFAVSEARDQQTRRERVRRTPNPIVEIVKKFVARVLDGGDMSVPKP